MEQLHFASCVRIKNDFTVFKISLRTEDGRKRLLSFNNQNTASTLASDGLHSLPRKQVGLGWAPPQQNLQLLQAQSCSDPPPLPGSIAGCKSCMGAHPHCKVMGFSQETSTGDFYKFCWIPCAEAIRIILRCLFKSDRILDSWGIT